MIESVFNIPETREHSEKLLIDFKGEQGISFDKVSRIYSELGYCNKCKNLIK